MHAPEQSDIVRAVRGTRLLLCDDDDLELAAVRRTAEASGFEIVDSARNAVELLRMAEALEADAAVIRNEVPGVSGVEATLDLTQRDPRVEVVLVTSDPSVEPSGKQAGAFAVVGRGDLDAENAESTQRSQRSSAFSAEPPRPLRRDRHASIPRHGTSG